MKTLTFELFAQLERLAGAHHVSIDVADVRDVAGALAALAQAHPSLAASLERCACVSGDTIVRRADPLPADGQLALLPPVAGG
jgi:molybdopterin synthase sulfur carrier subunit